MVAKIGTSSSIASALGYNMRKVEKSEAKIIGTNKISCPQGEEFSHTDIMRDFELHMPERYRTENPVFHVSLNPHPDDILSDMELSVIADEYMKRMGYSNQPYLVFKHEDISRHHLHIVSTRVDSTGKKINDKFERRRSKDITRSLEQKYGLRTAEKQSKTQKSELQYVDISKGDVKQQVETALREVNKRYHFMSFAEYKAVLSKLNITAEEVKGALYGKAYSGIVYSATDNNNNKVGNPLPANAIGNFAGVKALERKYIASKEIMEKSRMLSALKSRIDKAFAGATTKEQLKTNLFNEGVGVVYRESAEGRLYGITYIDHNTGATLNGSRLGKNYSANAITERLAHPQQLSHNFRHRIPTKLGGIELSNERRILLDIGKSIFIKGLTDKDGNCINAYVKRSEDSDKLYFYKHDPDVVNQSQPSQAPQPREQEQSHLQSQYLDHSDSFAGGGLGLFDLIPDNSDDHEEDAFRRQMQRQKKKKRGLRR